MLSEALTTEDGSTQKQHEFTPTRGKCRSHQSHPRNALFQPESHVYYIHHKAPPRNIYVAVAFNDSRACPSFLTGTSPKESHLIASPTPSLHRRLISHYSPGAADTTQTGDPPNPPRTQCFEKPFLYSLSYQRSRNDTSLSFLPRDPP
jgi:hypothetical protein